MKLIMPHRQSGEEGSFLCSGSYYDRRRGASGVSIRMYQLPPQVDPTLEKKRRKAVQSEKNRRMKKEQERVKREEFRNLEEEVWQLKKMKQVLRENIHEMESIHDCLKSLGFVETPGNFY